MVKCFPSCKPESNPAGVEPAAARYVHGASKEDWVTECERGELGNQKVTNVPFEAVMLAGWNVKVLLKATSMFFWPVVSAGAEGAAAGAAEEAAAGGAVVDADPESP